MTTGKDMFYYKYIVISFCISRILSIYREKCIKVHTNILNIYRYTWKNVGTEAERRAEYLKD